MSGKSGQNGFSAVGFLFSDSLLELPGLDYQAGADGNSQQPDLLI